MMKKVCWLVIALLQISLAGCGGGGGVTTPPATQLVSGVAATGLPITGEVWLKDSSADPKEMSTPINADGSFSFDVTALTSPFILKAVGSAGGQSCTLYSLAGAQGIANINPLSHLAVVKANHGADPAALYANPSAVKLAAMKTALAAIIQQIQACLQPLLSRYDAATTNFISDSYVADHTKLDLLFDVVAIQADNGNLTVTNKLSGAPILSSSLTGDTLSGIMATSNIPALTDRTVGSIFVYPGATASVSAGETIAFKTVVIGKNDQRVNWGVIEQNGGVITSAGVYTAPATGGMYHVSCSSPDGKSVATTTVVVTSASNSGAWTTPQYVGLLDTTIHALAVDPTNGQVLYAGMDGLGVLRTSNRGETWTSRGPGYPLIPRTSTANVRALAVDPVNGQVVYAGLYGLGLYKSTDGAASWTAMTAPLPNTINALAIDPNDNRTIYAGTGDGITSGGLFKSTFGGNGWIDANSGLPSNPRVKAITIDPRHSQTIYAGLFGNGVYKSTNGGSSWVPINIGLGNGAGLPTVNTLAIDPADSNVIYAAASVWYGSSEGVFKSTDGGATWSAVIPGYFTSLAINPVNSQIVYAGSYGDGVYRSTDAGASWQIEKAGMWHTGESYNIECLAIAPDDPRNVYTGTLYYALYKGFFP